MGICYITRREQREEVNDQLGIYCAGNDARPVEEVYVPDKVIVLATRVFQNDKYVTYIHLPPFLQEIQERAFENCEGLANIIFPDGLQAIHQYAFNGCTNLTKIEVPETIPLLKPYTFGGTNIKDLVLDSDFYPKQWDYAFADNHSIETATINCYLISKGCFSGSDISKIIIQGNTKVLKERAFENCKKLINIQLNSDLLEIGDYCFYNTNLSKITIPKTIQRIGIYCFGVNDEKLPGLKEVTFQDGLKVISQYSFYGTALESVIIPSSIENIGKYAFGNCTKLVDIQLTNGIKQLGMFEGYAFANCSVEKIIIPPSVEKITKYCFSDCTKLTRVQFTANIEKAKLEEGIFKNCTALNDVVLPDDMLYLGNNMFEKCTSLESIKLPENLQELGDYCFKGCSKLASLTIPESIKRIGKYCFEDTYIGKIALPRSLMEIEGYAFSGCDNLGTIEFDYFDAIVEIPTEQGLQIIRSNAFANSKVTNLNIPYTIQTIEKDAFKNMTIDTLHIDVIKTQAWIDAVKTWGIKSYKNLIWRQSVLYFNTNVPFFELYVSQNGITEKVKVDTSKQEYIFEPYNEGITLYYYAYAPNMALVQGKETYSRTQREVYYDFIFEEQAPYKIEFIVVDGDKNENDDDYIIKDAEILSDTIFNDFYYTYHDSIYYVNKGTDISYTVLKSGYGAVYGTIKDISDNQTITIALSKNGYAYVDIKYPFIESQEHFMNTLVDSVNYDNKKNFQIYPYSIYSNKNLSYGYIKFKTPEDITPFNRITIKGLLTAPSYTSYTSVTSFWCIVSPYIYYPGIYFWTGEPSGIQSEQILITYGAIDNDGSSSGSNNTVNIDVTKQINNLKPNTIYYILFHARIRCPSLNSDLEGYPLPNEHYGRLFLKRVTFNSCSLIPADAPILPDIISEKTTCLYDGIGRTSPLIDTSFIDNPILFELASNINLTSTIKQDYDSSVNCCANYLQKLWGINDSQDNNTDSALFKFKKKIQSSDYTKLKITYAFTTNYSRGLLISGYYRLCNEGEIKDLVPKVSYNWDDEEYPWTLFGSESSTSDQYVIRNFTIDLSNIDGEKCLYIGIHHPSTSGYTHTCRIIKIEFQQ